MGVLVKEKLVITRTFNNNIVLVKDKGVEKIVFGKGIGFNRKFGEVIDSGVTVDKIFVLENENTRRNFKEVLNRVDEKLFAFFEELIVDLANELEEELNENIHVSLIDHLNFAVKRLKNNEEITNPFIAEIETLYEREFKLAEKMSKKIEDKLNISIPDGEIGFITLHIHTARTNGKVSNTMKNSYICNTAIEHIEDMLDIEIHRKSIDYVRFVTHVRFAIERIMNKQNIKNDLMDIIIIRYKKSYKIAEEVGQIIEKSLQVDVSKDEIAYLAMHIERFRVSIDK